MIYYFALFAMIASFLVIIFFELRSKSAGIVLWAGLFVFYAIPHGVDVIRSSSNFNETTYLIASLFAFIFNVVYFCSSIIFNNIKVATPNWLLVSSGPKVKRYYTKILFFLLLTSVALFSIHVYITFGSFVNFTWIDLFNNRQSYLYLISSYLLTISSPLVYVALIQNKYRLFIFALLLSLFVLIISRVRSNAIAMMIPLIVYYLYYGGTFGKTLRRLFVTSFFGIFFIMVVLGFGAVRVFGDYSHSISFTDFFQTTFELVNSPHSEFGLRNAFYYFIENDNNFQGFNLGLGYIRLLLMPIPSVFSFDLKPIDFASYMSIAYAPDFSVLGVNSMHPTLYGDLFANFYYFGAFLGIFWAALVKVFNSLCLHQNRNIFAASIFVSVVYSFTLVARGAIYNGLFFVYFLLVVNWFFSLVLSRVVRPSSSLAKEVRCR